MNARIADAAAPLRLAFVVGSHHVDSQSEKVAHYLAALSDRLEPAGVQVLLPLADLDLPLWTEPVLDGPAGPVWREVAAELSACDGVALVTPEWGGMVPAALKNFLLYCTGHELAHKPGLIVSVSSGPNGAYPVAELRMSAGKNTRLCLVPDHLIVRDVDEMLNDDEPADSRDRALRARADHAVRQWLAYARALRSVRAQAADELERYPYGM